MKNLKHNNQNIFFMFMKEPVGPCTYKIEKIDTVGTPDPNRRGGLSLVIPHDRPIRFENRRAEGVDFLYFVG